jgi:hypothetical protein
VNQNYKNIHRYDFLTKEILEEEYVSNGLSDAQIAKKFNMPSKAVVWRKRKKFGIANKYAAKSNRHAVKNRKYNITRKKATQLLEDGETYTEIAAYMDCSVIVAKRRFQELGLTSRQDHAEKYTYWEVELTGSQKQMIIGSVLGDGTIARHGAYSCSHSIKQADYHKHKRDVLSSIHAGKFQHAIHKAQGVDGEHHESLHFTTGCNKFCSELRRIYYPNDKKVFPYSFLIEQMMAEAMAYWYMDDGSIRPDKKTSLIHSYGYSCLDNILIKELIHEKFGLVTVIHWDSGSNGYYHYFSTTETPKLFALIRPYIIPSMMYKIDLGI